MLTKQLDNTALTLEFEKIQYQKCQIELATKSGLLNEKQLNLVKTAKKLENAEAKIIKFTDRNHLLVKDNKS